jgi:hypothetical protein
MKKIVSFSLVIAVMAAPLSAGTAFAAELDGRSPFAENQRGAFAGVRLRAEMGGAGAKLRGGLAIAPTSHTRRGANSKMAIGEGVELGFSPGMKPELTLAGQRLDRMSLLGEKSAGDRANMSTIAKVAIVAGVVVVVGFVAFVHVAKSASCIHGDGNPGDC